MKSIRKKIATTLAVLTMFTTAVAFAATGTAEKPVGVGADVKSVSISGTGSDGTVYANIIGGTGSGGSMLYKFKRFWPDSLLEVYNVSTEHGPYNNSGTFSTENDAAYNVIASGDSSLGIRTSVVIN